MIMLYFSGTGNSAYIAKGFSRRMGADCHSVEEDIDLASLLSAHDTVAVCYPIYSSCVPRILRDFARLFPVREGERRRKQAAAERKLARVCRDIQSGVVRRRGWGWFSALLGKLQNTYWPAIEEKQAGSFLADGDCNRCGLCVRRCPVQNLELSEASVMQKNSCILCYRCVNLCPQKAATVMLHTKPKRQYKGIEFTDREKLW